jgi:hypothetical protein
MAGTVAGLDTEVAYQEEDGGEGVHPGDGARKKFGGGSHGTKKSYFPGKANLEQALIFT